jgi:hypothetical protein
MGRESNKATPVNPGPVANDAAHDEAANAARALAVADAAALQNAQAIARQFGYDGALTQDALEQQIRYGTGRMAEATMAIGASFLMLRELTPHGQFIDKVQALGYSDRTVRRLMSVALKFSKTANLAVLTKAAGSQTKLIELALLDDGEIAELAKGGTARGITLDKLETMTATELRAEVRQSRKDAEFEADKRQKAESRADTAEKKLRGKVPAIEPMDERLAPFQKDITERHSLMEKCVMADVEAITALQVWWEAEAAAQAERDGLAGDEYVPMPPAARAVLLHLDAKVQQLASWVGLLQHTLLENFAGELQQARQYLMQEPDGEDNAATPRRSGKRG